MTRPVTLVLALLTMAQQTVGTLDVITQWFKGVGIEYVPPLRRDGTCRDCTSREVRDTLYLCIDVYLYIS